MQVIVNVDDAGLHPAVNRAVEELAAVGTVSSATVMANGHHAHDAAGIHGAGLGAHLNILRGKPLGNPDALTSLVDDDGMLLGDYGRLFGRYVTGRINPEEVYQEWVLQVERLMELGIRPDHLDSEKHIHAWPTLMDVAARVAQRFDIGWIRHPIECSQITRLDKGAVRVRFLNVCSFFQRKPKTVAWPDSIWGIADQGKRLRPEYFVEYVRRNGLDKSDAVVEICCHPGRPLDDDPPLSPEYGNMRVDAQWKDEYEALSDPSWKDAFSELNATLVRFSDLG